MLLEIQFICTCSGALLVVMRPSTATKTYMTNIKKRFASTMRASGRFDICPLTVNPRVANEKMVRLNCFSLLLAKQIKNY